VEMVTSFCRSFAPDPFGAGLTLRLALSLMMAGLVGSFVHCVPMCGPFVLGQVSDRLACIPACAMRERHRIGTGLLRSYHLGRIATYTALGALAGGTGAALGMLPWFGWLSAGLLGLAALLFLGQAVRRLAMPIGSPALFHRLAARLGGQADRRPGRPCNGFTLGLALGFLPCGFLYSALAASAATADAAGGAIGMLAFGLGTVPALVLVGIAGEAAGHAWRRRMALVAPAVMLFNAAVLAALAWQRWSQFG
jgi:uncharacterized protein